MVKNGTIKDECENCGKIFDALVIIHEVPEDNFNWEKDSSVVEIEHSNEYPHFHTTPNIASIFCPDCLKEKIKEYKKTQNFDRCPTYCGKSTFCHKGEPLPNNKATCYAQQIICPKCNKPQSFINDDGLIQRIPTPKSTRQYWQGRVCECP
jgi:hypothetical protein